MDGRVRPEGTNDPLQLRLNNHSLLLRAGEDKHAAGSLACITQHSTNVQIQTSVFDRLTSKFKLLYLNRLT